MFTLTFLSPMFTIGNSGMFREYFAKSLSMYTEIRPNSLLVIIGIFPSKTSGTFKNCIVYLQFWIHQK